MNTASRMNARRKNSRSEFEREHSRILPCGHVALVFKLIMALDVVPGAGIEPARP